MDDMKKVGAVGWKTVLYFLCTTAIACVIGLALANVFHGAGLFPDLSKELGSASYEAAEFGGFMSTLVGIFPSNMWEAFRTANMLQVIVIALFFGGAIMAAGEKGKLCRDLVSSFNEVINRLMEFIIALSPIGVFATCPGWWPTRAPTFWALWLWCWAAPISATFSTPCWCTPSPPRSLQA